MFYVIYTHVSNKQSQLYQVRLTLTNGMYLKVQKESNILSVWSKITVHGLTTNLAVDISVITLTIVVHYRVALSLYVKVRPRAQPLI